MILEGIVTTMSAEGEVNIAPMGPSVEESSAGDWERFVLRPFKGSRTYRNLEATREGVLHVSDDALLFAQAIIGNPDVPLAASTSVKIPHLANCCRYYEFTVDRWDQSGERSRLEARVVHRQRVRDFFGFHRARHAVIEAAILASRVHILPWDEIATQFEHLRILVEKTGGPREHEAFDLLAHHVHAINDSRTEQVTP
ncbi:hypothetical protein Pan216_58130 [Planctomycetes bacterium Pan216]|uniref:DUF447 family protein n=1 Tax=Kolteria novifilia TaxID=2527975 RepID=A0A518BD71_9BACT|nr:hypothetical protein Pan216_58130 [Planctomycetes bacterium Pan216]